MSTSLIRKLLRKDAPAKIRDRAILKLMQLRGASPLNVTLREAETFFRFASEGNRKLARQLGPYIRRSRCIFDVGANAGFFARELCSQNPDYRGTLVMFEPIPHLMSLATRVMAPFTGVEKVFVNSALGDEDGNLDFFLPPNANIGWITAARTTTAQSHRVQARVSRAEGFVRRYRPDIIKIDVEGYEVPVLRSMLPALGGDYLPVLLIELEFEPDSPFRHDRDAAVAELRAKGYGIHDLSDRELTDAELRALTHTVDVIIRPLTVQGLQ